MSLSRENKEFMQEQLKLIARIEWGLQELEQTTHEDGQIGKELWSHFPEQCMKLMKIMRYAIEIELKEEEEL